MRKGFTLIEMIFVIVISSALSIGTFKAIQALYVRSAKAQAVTELSLRSQIVLDQLSLLLYNRIPNSVIGYDIVNNSCEPITALGSDSYTILEWLGTMDDELLRGDYDGFVDMGASDSATSSLVTKDINTSLNSLNPNLVFAGSFDSGAEESNAACSGAFGWHGKDSDLSYSINVIDVNETNLTDSVQPAYIYEKYYLTKTAYAIARGYDLQESDLIDNCANYSPPTSNNFDFDNTLFLFYNYQPFNDGTNDDETFCGDSRGTRVGDVSILSEDISAFEATFINETIRLNLDSNRSIRGSTNDVHISKQKAVF